MSEQRTVSLPIRTATTSSTSSTSPTATPTATPTRATCLGSTRRPVRASSPTSASSARSATSSGLTHGEKPPYEIYVKEKAVLNQQHERAYVAVKLDPKKRTAKGKDKAEEDRRLHRAGCATTSSTSAPSVPS